MLDDELYERFVTEVRRNIESRNSIRENNPTNPSVSASGATANTNINGRNSHGDLYAGILRNLLYIDYVFMLITLPMTLYTIFNTIIHLITFDFNNSDNVNNVMSKDHIFHKLQTYFKYVSVEDDMMSTNTSSSSTTTKGKIDAMLHIIFHKLFNSIKTINFESMTVNENEFNNKPSEMDIIDTLGLLGKFHKIIRYYTTPLENVKFYPLIIKSVTTVFFLLYGFIGSSYVILLNMFFMLCLMLTLFRRYQDVAEIIIKQFW